MAKSNSGIIFALAAAGALFLAGSGGKRGKSSSSGSRNPPLGTPPDDCVDTEVGVYRGLNFIEVLTGGAQPGERLPMVIALHGLGYDKFSIEDPLKGLGTARVIIPDAFYDRSEGLSGRRWWKGSSGNTFKSFQDYLAWAIPDASENLAPFVEGIQKCYPTYGKPVITGHSQGGYVALDFAASFPNLIKGSVPISALRPKGIWDNEPRVPVSAIMGKHDDNYDVGKEYYEEMIARGAPLTFRTTGGAHRLAEANITAWRQEIESLLYA